MEIVTLALAAIMAGGVLVFVLQPVWQAIQPTETEEDAAAPVDRLEELYARRDAIYQSIKEIEFDYKVGKLTEEDYQYFSAQLKREAAEVLRQIDELQAQQASIREVLEKRIQELREQLGTTVAGTPPTPAPAVASAGTGATGDTYPRFCTQCGAPLRGGDRFCSQCGAPVRVHQ